MKISNKYDVPSVVVEGRHYFPQDKSELVKKDGGLFATIQGIERTGGKLRQDTYYICPLLFLDLLSMLVKYMNKN